MEILTKLKDPLLGIKKDDIEKVKSAFSTIADDLFNHYCINCNGTEYYFAEIEFYYYNKEEWHDKWNKVTYSRRYYVAGDLFYHLSGIDICFDSYYDDEDARFGGILIRAIRDENDKVHTGPLNCKDELLNACHGKAMPELRKIMRNVNYTPTICSTKRALGADDIKKGIDKPYNLCFYDEVMKNKSCFLPTLRYDKAKGKVVSINRNYPTNRFYDGE